MVLKSCPASRPAIAWLAREPRPVRTPHPSDDPLALDSAASVGGAGDFSREEKAKTLPERLEVQEQLVSARLAEIKQSKGSLTNLYAVLSDAQKKEADDIVLPMAGMMGGPAGGPMGPSHWWRRQ